MPAIHLPPLVTRGCGGLVWHPHTWQYRPLLLLRPDRILWGLVTFQWPVLMQQLLWRRHVVRPSHLS
jgi:hypothetical protein